MGFLILGNYHMHNLNEGLRTLSITMTGLPFPGMTFKSVCVSVCMDVCMYVCMYVSFCPSLSLFFFFFFFFFYALCVSQRGHAGARPQALISPSPSLSLSLSLSHFMMPLVLTKVPVRRACPWCPGPQISNEAPS